MKSPNWLIVVVIYLIYNGIIYATWYSVGADYTNMTGVDVALQRLDLPLILGAIFMLISITWLGWWRPIMTEDRRGRPGWVFWVIALFMVGTMVGHTLSTNWNVLGAAHIGMLIVAGILVGLNEEALARGVLVAGFRGSTQSEVNVWFWSTLLFGLMHLPNALFGLDFISASAQVVFAFMAGTGLYLIRRVSGSIIPAMVLHGAWDFFSFARGASDGPMTTTLTVFQFGTYFVSIILVAVVLIADRRNSKERVTLVSQG